MSRKIVTSYVNPDLDGVACCLASCELYPDWEAAIIGELDAETVTVLKAIQIDPPRSINIWDNISEIWLVDTHHPQQLPSNFPHEFVTRITDHHPGGDAVRYSAAKIENEKVGAAATLITEQFERKNKQPTAAIAVLLQAAIMSNTLELRSPSTSERDRNVLNTLSSISPLREEIIIAMREARSLVVDLPTETLLRRDCKIFDTSYGRVAIAQVEALDAINILIRDDLHEAMRNFAQEKQAKSAVLSLVDTRVNKGAIVVTDLRVGESLCKGHAKTMDHELVIRFDRLIQRKTDILPFIV